MRSSPTSKTSGWIWASGVGHTLVLGTTRVGKTRLAEVLITQDIRRGDVVIVFDPKGDADLLRRVYAEAKHAGRAKGLHALPSRIPGRLGPLQRDRSISPASPRWRPGVANQLPSEGNSAAFKEFAWRFVNIIARALVALGQTARTTTRSDATSTTSNRCSSSTHVSICVISGPRELGGRSRGDSRPRISERNLAAALRGRDRDAIALMRYLQAQDLYDPVLDGLVSAFKYDKTYFDKIVSSVGPLMEKVDHRQDRRTHLAGLPE